MSSEILITNEEVEILNAARTILLDIDIRATEMKPEAGEAGFALGRLGATSFTAHGLMLSVLSIAQSYCDVELTHEQVHNDPAVVLNLPKPKPKGIVMHDDNGKG